MVTHCHSIWNSKLVHQTDEVSPTCFGRTCTDYISCKDDEIRLFSLSYISDDVFDYFNSFRIFLLPMKVSVLGDLESTIFSESEFRLICSALCSTTCSYNRRSNKK